MSRLPIMSVYADGRVLSDGPVEAIYPGPALPNVQETTIDQGTVQDLVNQAMAAGVAETSDLGSPPVADAPSTRFTVVTADETYQREVYALFESPLEGGGLTPDQEAARAKLSDLLATLTASPPARQRRTSRTPWRPSPRLGSTPVTVSRRRRPPGPARRCPGNRPAPRDVGCVTATGDQARALLGAAASANAATPWVGADGTRWSVIFRPLLPDESGCADLTD